MEINTLVNDYKVMKHNYRKMYDAYLIGKMTGIIETLNVFEIKAKGINDFVGEEVEEWEKNILSLLEEHDELTFKELVSKFKSTSNENEIRSSLEILEMEGKIQSYMHETTQTAYALSE